MIQGNLGTYHLEPLSEGASWDIPGYSVMREGKEVGWMQPYKEGWQLSVVPLTRHTPCLNEWMRDSIENVTARIVELWEAQDVPS